MVRRCTSQTRFPPPTRMRGMRAKARRWRGWAYYDNYLVDNASCVVVGVQATSARLSQESAAARDMIEGYGERYGRRPQSLAADNTYGNGELLHWLEERGIIS